MVTNNKLYVYVKRAFFIKYKSMIRQRIPRRLLFYHRSLVHRGRKILSLAFGFDKEEDVYQFAAAAPYSYSRLQKYLALWEKRALAFATRESIAQTTVSSAIHYYYLNIYYGRS